MVDRSKLKGLGLGGSIGSLSQILDVVSRACTLQLANSDWKFRPGRFPHGQLSKFWAGGLKTLRPDLVQAGLVWLSYAPSAPPNVAAALSNDP